MPFEFENKLFRTLIAENEKYAKPQSILDKSLSIADTEFPLSDEESRVFANRCINALKKKADVLSSLLPHGIKLSHKKCLNLIANMCFFEGYDAFKSYAESFSSMGATNRATSGNTIKLVCSLWRTPDNFIDPFFLQSIAVSAAILELNSELNNDVCILLAGKIFRDPGVAASKDCITEPQVGSCVARIHKNPGLYYFNRLLSYPPFLSNREQALDEFSEASFEDFINCQVLYPLDMGLFTKIPVSLTAKEMLLMEIMADIHENGEIEGLTRKQIIKKLAATESRVEVERFIIAMYSRDLHLIVGQAREQ